MALYRFYQIVKSLPPGFELKRVPITIKAFGMFLWMTMSFCEMFFTVEYYSNWESYDNVTKCLTVSDVSNMLDLLMYNVMAHSLFKMSGANICCYNF